MRPFCLSLWRRQRYLPVLNLATRHRASEVSPSSVLEGVARHDRRTKDLVKRLKRGDVAIIQHLDLDGVAARALADCRPAFVVNLTDSLTGRYPNSGPSILLDAGIPVLDCFNPALLETLKEGETVRLDGDTLHASGKSVGKGRLLTRVTIAELLEVGRRNVTGELRGFAENTLRHLSEEATVLLDPVDLPNLKTTIAGRHVVVVVRGEGHREDLLQILPYIQEQRPVLMAVDGGADALLELGLQPHIIFGDMDSVSDRALTSPAEIVVHAYADGTAPGLQRVQSLKKEGATFPVSGTSEDAAFLLAYEHGAEMIVAVGTHSSLVDFLDKGRAGMASTFLVRLKVGSILVDARGVSRLYRPGVRSKHIGALLVGAAVPLVMVFLLSPKLNSWLQLLKVWFQLYFWDRLH